MITNEITYAKSLEMCDFTRDYDYLDKCVILTRYWIFHCNYDINEVKDLLFSKIRMVSPAFSEDDINGFIHNLLIIANQKGCLSENIIKIPKKALDYIHSLDDITLEKMLFILSYLQLYYNNSFVLNIRFLQREARIKTAISSTFNKLHILIINNFITTNIYKDGVNYKIIGKLYELLYNENDEIGITIEKHTNVINYYFQYLYPKEYKKCERCDTIFKINSNKQKYCSDCARIIKNKQNKMYREENRNS